ncbi:uncharacterized protein LOC135145769 [Zophobas morio]|uniref:uncharacterized protein LOC135145769 n=1 Tax=Zophobas morio TaxID=2755281 RepID=UPI003083E22F
MDWDESFDAAQAFSDEDLESIKEDWDADSEEEHALDTEAQKEKNEKVSYNPISGISEKKAKRFLAQQKKQEEEEEKKRKKEELYKRYEAQAEVALKKSEELSREADISVINDLFEHATDINFVSKGPSSVSNNSRESVDLQATLGSLAPRTRADFESLGEKMAQVVGKYCEQALGSVAVERFLSIILKKLDNDEVRSVYMVVNNVLQERQRQEKAQKDKKKKNKKTIKVERTETDVYARQIDKLDGFEDYF